MRKLFGIVLTCMLITPTLSALAAPAYQDTAGEVYIVQAGDWLSKLAEKYYGDPLAYPTIVEATNARAGEDDSFTTITNPDVIEVGQKLWIPAPPMTTQVIAFVPADIPTETRSGSCFTNAIGLGREDAYRCTVGNQLFDPCFAVDDVPTVVCGANPATGETGFVLELTEPLPAPNVGQLAQPWLVDLADGQVCGLLTGTVPGVGDRVAPYGCPDGSNLFEDFRQDGEVWMAEKAVIGLNDDGFFVEQSELVPIRRVWQ